MGLTPEQFWGSADDIYTGMTLREFDLYAQGFKQRTEMNQELLAWHAANVMNMWTKKGHSITPAKLLGKEEAKLDPKALQAELNAQKAKREKKADMAKELTKLEVYDAEQDRVETDSWMQGVLMQLERAEPGDTLDEEEED